MRAIWTIAWREFRVLATSPMFFGISGLCAVVWTYQYLRAIQAFALQAQRPGVAEHANIHYSVFMQHLGVVNMVLLFVVPVLTMRLIAEEKKQRTFDLLLTAPITSTHISLGKFLGGYMVALALVLIAFIYPMGTALIADFQWAPLLSAFIGLAAVVGGYVAIGLFSSSVTSSPIMSAIMGLILILFVWFLGMGADMTDNPIATAVLSHISVGHQFSPFVQGGYRISSAVFFMSLMGLFVFLTDRVVESSRWR